MITVTQKNVILEKISIAVFYVKIGNNVWLYNYILFKIIHVKP